ncbi:MAG: hypothetical protein RR900_08725, partial [Ruthenibacterium sp.]
MKTRMYLKRLVGAALAFCMALGLMPSGQMATSPAPIGGLNQVSFSGGNTIITPGVPNLTRMTLGAKMETSVTAQTASGQPLESRLFKVAYRSDNPKLVTVDAKGVLRALGSVPGMTTVHATVTYAKVSKTADLIVSVSGQNLLKDGSFEQNRTLSNVWRSAREEKYGGSANVVSGDAHSGKSAYQVVLSPAQKNQATQLSLADKRLVPVKSGKFYELSAWIKVSAFADGKDSTAASV